MERESRLEGSRSFETRDAEIRAYLNMDYVDPLHVPQSKWPEGMEYQWVRESIMGQFDGARISEMRRRGWTYVPADRHPEMVPPFDPTRPSHLTGTIYYKGLVLCERPKEYGDIERKKQHDYNMALLNSIPGQENLMNEPTMPMKTFVNQTNIQTTAKFKE